MKVFSDKITIKKNEDDSFNISIQITDTTVTVKTVTRPDIEQLYVDIEQVLKG